MPDYEQKTAQPCLSPVHWLRKQQSAFGYSVKITYMRLTALCLLAQKFHDGFSDAPLSTELSTKGQVSCTGLAESAASSDQSAVDQILEGRRTLLGGGTPNKECRSRNVRTSTESQNDSVVRCLVRITTSRDELAKEELRS